MYEDEFEEDEYDYDAAIILFLNKLVLNKLFTTLPKTFTADDFLKLFQRKFKNSGIETRVIVNAFAASIDLEMIELVDEENKLYSFNGIAIATDDFN